VNVLRLDFDGEKHLWYLQERKFQLFILQVSAAVLNIACHIFYCLFFGITARTSIAMTSAPPPTSSDASASKRTFIIGTRQSKLALLQTNLVLAALKEANPDCSFDIHSRETAGDKNTNIAFREFTTKNLWTEELEELLIAGHVDLIVHSLKGMFLVLRCWYLSLVRHSFLSLFRCPNPHSIVMYPGPDDEA